jgi:general secretion pathway protein G
MVILIVIAVVMPRYPSPDPKARNTATEIQIHNLRLCLHEFEKRAGRLPTEQEGLQALVERPSGLAGELWHGSLLEQPEVPTDAFRTPFRYTVADVETHAFELTSAGPDRLFDTADDIKLVNCLETSDGP